MLCCLHSCFPRVPKPKPIPKAQNPKQRPSLPRRPHIIAEHLGGSVPPSSRRPTHRRLRKRAAQTRTYVQVASRANSTKEDAVEEMTHLQTMNPTNGPTRTNEYTKGHMEAQPLQNAKGVSNAHPHPSNSSEARSDDRRKRRKRPSPLSERPEDLSRTPRASPGRSRGYEGIRYKRGRWPNETDGTTQTDHGDATNPKSRED